MKDKFVSVFFGTVSLCIWAATICLILFCVVLLLTGMERRPVFRLNEASLQAVSAEDPVLAQNGRSGDNWYRLELDMNVAASNLSPFSYTAETFVLKAPRETAAGHNWFVVLDEPLLYSKASPDDYRLDLYIQYPEGEEALAADAAEFGFGIRRLMGHYGFITYDFVINMPGFYLSDFSVPIRISAA